jgi:hypothetical protein
MTPFCASHSSLVYTLAALRCGCGRGGIGGGIGWGGNNDGTGGGGNNAGPGRGGNNAGPGGGGKRQDEAVVSSIPVSSIMRAGSLAMISAHTLQIVEEMADTF